MTIFNLHFSITGLILALLFLILALWIFSFNTDGQGSTLKLFITFPWFFIGMDKIPLWIGIIPNTIITYFIGFGIESLIFKFIKLF